AYNTSASLFTSVSSWDNRPEKGSRAVLQSEIVAGRQPLSRRNYSNMACRAASLDRCSMLAFLFLFLLLNPLNAQLESQDPFTSLPDDTGELVQGSAPSMSASDFLAAANQITSDKIQTVRMRIYRQFVQNLAMKGASTAALGQIVDLPQPPFTNMTLQLVKLKLSSLVANGFLFHEFFIPPGIQVSTNPELVVLLYNQIPVIFAPYRPPTGYSYSPYFAGVDILPYVNDTTKAPGPVLVRTSPSLPITVTFPFDDSQPGQHTHASHLRERHPWGIYPHNRFQPIPFSPAPRAVPSAPPVPANSANPHSAFSARNHPRRQGRVKRADNRASDRARDTDYSPARAGRVADLAAAAARALREDGAGGGARREPRDCAHRGAARAVRARRAHQGGAGGRGVSVGEGRGGGDAGMRGAGGRGVSVGEGRGEGKWECADVEEGGGGRGGRGSGNAPTWQREGGMGEGRDGKGRKTHGGGGGDGEFKVGIWDVF
ncbi:unnamed protein product, partial [Closterium sp. NIES-54]